jgi:hypothetical protein
MYVYRGLDQQLTLCAMLARPLGELGTHLGG